MEANSEYLRSRHRATQAQQLVAVAITSEHAPHLTKCLVCRRTVWGHAAAALLNRSEQPVQIRQRTLSAIYETS